MSFGMLHEITGTVVRGNRIGRTLGFPTANIPLAGEVSVRDGVYAAQVRVEGLSCPAMVNIGTRPTVGDGAGRFAEAHLLGFEGDLYGKSVTVILLEYLRAERRFASLEALRCQLAEDRCTVTEYFENGR